MNIDSLIQRQVAQSYNLLGCAVATISRTVNGQIDPTTGAPSTSSVSTESARCKLDGASMRSLGFKFGDGLVVSGDILATIPALDPGLKTLAFEPQAGDTFVANNLSLLVVEVRPSYAPGGTPTEYALLVRK